MQDLHPTAGSWQLHDERLKRGGELSSRSSPLRSNGERWQPAGLTEGSTPSGVGARPDPSTTASRSVGLDCPRQSKSSPGDWTTQHSPSPALRDGEDLYVRFRSIAVVTVVFLHQAILIATA